MDKLLYILVENSEWEDIIIYDNKEDAISASLKHPSSRVEIFKQKSGEVGYIPTYKYYRNGVVN